MSNAKDDSARVFFDRLGRVNADAPTDALDGREYLSTDPNAGTPAVEPQALMPAIDMGDPAPAAEELDSLIDTLVMLAVPELREAALDRAEHARRAARACWSAYWFSGFQNGEAAAREACEAEAAARRAAERVERAWLRLFYLGIRETAH